MVPVTDLLAAGRFEEAEPLLRERVQRDPADLEATLQLAELYRGWSDFERAVPLAEKGAALADSIRAAGSITAGTASRAHLRLAQAYGLKAHKLSLVRGWLLTKQIRGEFERAVALDPSSIEARSGLVTFHTNVPGLGGGSLDEAVKQAGELAKFDPARGTRLLSVALFKQGKEQAAFAALDRLAVTDLPQAQLGRGWLYFKKKQPERVVGEMNALLKAAARGAGSDAKARAAALTEGGQLLTVAGRPDGALPLLAAASAADPTLRRAEYEAGRAAALARTSLASGEAALRRYLSVETGPQQPSHASARLQLARILDASGRRNEARAEIREAARLEPGNGEIAGELKRLVQ
jgi:tetratricopeptide (TPR) repeat protein